MAGASPPTAESVAPIDRPTAVVRARTDGTTFIAAVVPGSPTFRPAAYSTIRPSGLTKFEVAREAWYCARGTRMPGGGTAGRVLAGPSWLCSAVYTAGDSVGPVGFSGPVTWVRILLASSLLVATASGPGFCHTGALNRKISVVGFAADGGKSLLSR